MKIYCQLAAVPGDAQVSNYTNDTHLHNSCLVISSHNEVVHHGVVYKELPRVVKMGSYSGRVVMKDARLCLIATVPKQIITR